MTEAIHIAVDQEEVKSEGAVAQLWHQTMALLEKEPLGSSIFKPALDFAGVYGSLPAGQGESLCALLPRAFVGLLRTGGIFFPGTNERKGIRNN
ncbi:hypothetical protein RvY_08587 [Ramazzottius varieornatus]|uniref:Uncharacterized protein n=1 Tax=Ramazzottius varieornatus TaxID=947166 RepID=A0A1D1V8N3_RAMVA|nr:hypothetical protein RvY_08587 [Ramazzottius varieornatus]